MAGGSSPKRSHSASVWAKSRAVTLTSWPWARSRSITGRRTRTWGELVKSTQTRTLVGLGRPGEDGRHLASLRLGEHGADRQRDVLRRQRLGHRQRAGGARFIDERRHGGLAMQRDAVVVAGLHALLRQGRQKGVGARV